MVVSHADASRILSGRKSQLRIPQSRVAPAVGDVVPVTVRETNAHLGYDQHGKPKTQLVERCRIRVLDVLPALLSDVDLAAARAEGYRNATEFKTVWLARHGSHEQVWVLAFERDTTHRPRFLSRVVIAGRQGDYTENPVRSIEDAGEAVEDDFLERYAHDNRERHKQRTDAATARIARLSVDDQLRVLTHLAHTRHVSIRAELRLIRRFRHDATLVERQLARIRDRLSPSQPVELPA